MSDDDTLQQNEPLCWSFSPHGVRCEGLAGHSGLHHYQTVWSDESSWKPNQATHTQTGGQDVPIVKIQPLKDETLIHTCVACNHSTLVHAGGGGPCEMCDCRALIY